MRGRPRVFSEKNLGSSDLSPRQQQNHAYGEVGRTRLHQYWEEEIDAPLCVLSELGRIRDETKFREAAWWYRFSARGLTGKQGASKIRNIRLGKTPQVGPVSLFERLLKTVEDFRIDYDDASHWYVERQVELLLETVRYFCRYR